MIAERAVAITYLVMAVLNLAWQTAALRRLVKGSTTDSRITQFYGGLLRTARCRAGAATLYLGVGLNALYPQIEVALVALAVHALTQGVFMLNARSDLRLGRGLSAILQNDPSIAPTGIPTKSSTRPSHRRHRPHSPVHAFRGPS